MAAKSNLLNMALCLTLVCLVCSALLGGMYALTAEPIAKTNADILRASVNAVLPEGGELSEAVPVEVGGQASEYYISKSADGTPAAYAIKSTAAGFGGPLTVMVGLTPDGKVYNTSVLSHSETPGLGAKCTEDDAVDHDQRDEKTQGLVHIRRICLHRELKDSDESSDDHDIYRDMDLVRNHRCDSGNHDVRQH